MTATLKESLTEPAPVSLAEIKARGLDFGSFFGDFGYARLSPEERDALVELADAALEWQKKSAAYVRCFDLEPYQESVADQLAAERDAAGARLALAAKGVRP